MYSIKADKSKNIQDLNISSKLVLNNGVEMPWLGIGTLYAKEGGEVESAVSEALKSGYRKIDTASAYKNLKGVGEGIRRSGIPRDEIFISSKVDNHEQGYTSTIKACEKTLNYLQTDYLDLYLIHWPGKHFLETWKAMEELYYNGLIRSIGVSNFLKYHLEYLFKECKTPPAVNQIELHPKLTQKELVQYCKAKNIQVVSWRPIMQGKVNRILSIQEIAGKYGKTPVQIVLRWNIQNGIATVPGYATREWMISNADIFDFQLDEKDISKINSLNENLRLVDNQYDIKFLLKALPKLKQKIPVLKKLLLLTVKKILKKIT